MKLEANAIRLEDIAVRLEAIAIRNKETKRSKEKDSSESMATAIHRQHGATTALLQVPFPVGPTYLEAGHIVNRKPLTIDLASLRAAQAAAFSRRIFRELKVVDQKLRQSTHGPHSARFNRSECIRTN